MIPQQAGPGDEASMDSPQVDNMPAIPEQDGPLAPDPQQKVIGQIVITDNLICGICLKKYSTKFNLIKHTKLHSGKCYQCDTPGCKYVGQSPYHLNQYQLTCKDLVEFLCLVCKCKKFSNTGCRCTTTLQKITREKKAQKSELWSLKHF